MAEKVKYLFNGQTYTIKGRLCHDIVKYYVEQNPNATLAALQKAFNTATHMIVATPEMALTVVNSDGKAGGDYYMKEADQIPIKDGKVVVWSYWPESFFKPFMEQVKALGYNVKEQEVVAQDLKQEEAVEEQEADVLQSAIAKIKISMEENDLSSFNCFSHDNYGPIDDEIKERLMEEIPDSFEDENVDLYDLFDWGQGEFSIMSNNLYHGLGEIDTVIRRIDYRDGELSFLLQVVLWVGDREPEVIDSFPSETVEDMINGTQDYLSEYYNVERTLQNIADHYINNDILVALSKMVEYDPGYDYDY